MAGIADDLDGIKSNVADLRGNNQVARFAYTQDAYTNDEAAGAASFDIDNDNNIPTKDAATLNVNPTILDRGYQTQASSLTRQLQNHFFGRVSYNLNKIVDRVWDALGTLSAAMGRSDSAAGDKTYIATLDAAGRLPRNQLTSDTMEFRGYWDASVAAAGGSPDLLDASNQSDGNFFIVSSAGTKSITGTSREFNVSDIVIFDGTSNVWRVIPATYVKGGAEADSAYRTGKVNITLTSLGIADVKNYDQSKALNGLTVTQNSTSTSLSLSRLDGSTAASGTISAMSGATSNAAGKAGLVPQPASTEYTKFLRGDGTWQVPANTTYSVFVKSGSTAAAGLVPAPSTTAGTTKYLREDATWNVPPNTTYSLATSSANGLLKALPSSAGINDYILCGQNNWVYRAKVSVGGLDGSVTGDPGTNFSPLRRYYRNLTSTSLTGLTLAVEGFINYGFLMIGFDIRFNAYVSTGSSSKSFTFSNVLSNTGVMNYIIYDGVPSGINELAITVSGRNLIVSFKNPNTSYYSGSRIAKGFMVCIDGPW